MKLYALYDRKAEGFSAYQVAKADAVVSREFAQAVLEPKSLLGKYPDDFALVCFGEVPGEPSEEGEFMLVASEVLTARQVVDLQPKAGASVDPAQLALLREA